MSLTLSYNASLSGVETVSDVFASANDATVTLNGLSASGDYNSGSGVPVTKQAAGRKTLSTGAGTLDLTALPGGVGGATVDGTGLKVQFAKFRNKSTNSNTMTISQGASNDYELAGDFSITLAVGQEVTLFLNEAAPDIASGDKTIDIAGTGSEVLEYHIVMG